MSLLVLTTGGTISALPTDDYRKETLATTMVQSANRDMVREVLEKKPGSQARFVAMEFRDSRAIDEAYRLDILKHIEDASEEKILIAHGTDTILQTANFLYRHVQDNVALADKVILLTGSMLSLAQGPHSDAFLNLDFALKSINSLTPSGRENVYIVLCDYENSEAQSGAWTPYLYKYAPGVYEKFYTEDGRYNRLKRFGGK